ncbi:hypothetical protein EIM92_00495 [Paenibacillus lentus]|uniref:HNH/Endo VII superfamily nuclease toxins domain-containing protein n=2 Tax=Paenibacillus lentus TaxID=1338368 RepID=A0A3Q8S750_9BACL|nr:hypothetical protein EIM92_00495 [Paenibacillus lentus]
MKGVDRAVDAFQAVKKTASMMPSPMRQDLGKVWTKARKLGNNLGLGEQLGKIKNAMQRLSVGHPRLAHAVSTSANVGQQVAMQYTRSLAIEAAMEAGGRIEFIGNFIEQIGGDKMRAAITWVSIATNKGRSKGKGTTGLNRHFGFTSGGGSGGSGKRGGSKDTGTNAKKPEDVNKVLTHNGAFRDAKRRAGIPNSIQHKKPVYVHDGTSENRKVYEFEVDGKKKYIIEHRDDKFGRGPHFHGADDLKGNPLEKGRYNQYPGHSPEDFDGYKKKGKPQKR